MHTKLNCPLDGPAPFAIVSTSGHRMQQNNKMRTRIFRVSSLSRSHALADKIPTMIKPMAAQVQQTSYFPFQSIFKISRASQLSKTTSHQRHRILVPQNSVSKRIERQKCEATKCTPAYNTRSNRCKLILFY